MKKSIANISIILIVLCLSFSCCYMFYKAIKILEKYKIAYKINESNFNTFKKSINESLSKIILLDHLKILPEYCYVYNKKNTDSISTNCFANKILLIIPELSCNSCYDDVYYFLHYASDSLGINIPILTTKTRYREIKNILSDYSLKSDLYYIKLNYFLKSKDEIEFAPYFIYVDHDKTCYHMFIPLTNHPDLTKTYLINIKQRYESILHE